MNRFKKIIVFLFVIFAFNLFITEVEAISVSKGDYIKLSDYGLNAKETTHNRTSYKTSNGKEAYCIQVKKTFNAGTYTTDNCTRNGINSSLVSSHMIVAGQIVDIIDKKDWSTDKKYAYKVAALNQYFKSLNLPLSSGSADYDNADLSTIISSAKNNASYYGGIVEKISKPVLEVSNNKVLMTISGSTSNFISNKITFGNLHSKFNGTTPVYTFTASGKGTFYLCTSKTGGCKPINEVKVSGKESISYYLKVVGADAGSNVSVTINVTSSANYLEGTIYCNGTGNQAVLMTDSKSQTYQNKNTVTFQVPDTTNHRISILKVDESGEAVNGSEFKLYEEATKKELTLTKNGSSFDYVSPIVAETEDTFFNKRYCYEETVVPFGYRKGTDACFEVTKKNSTTCYFNDTSESVDDMDFCNNNIMHMCKIQTTVVDVTVTENPNQEGEGTESDAGSEVEGNNQNVIIEQEGEMTVTTDYSDLAEGGCVAPESTKEPTETGYKKTTYVAETKCVLKNSDGSFVEKDEKYCSSKDHYSLIKVNSGNVFITVPNQKNNIVISKQAITGDKEIAGAHLKICTDSDYTKDKSDCKATSTVDNVKLSWISADSSVEFTGLKPGIYYIVETIPPAGYKLSGTTATKFSIDEAGVIEKGDTKVEDNKIIIDNELNSLTISKTDIATGKELPGAKLAICTTVTTNIDTDEKISDDKVVDDSKKKYVLELDINNNCLPVYLADGSLATWVSTNQPHEIKGLPAGTYYLVETSAPNGYTTTESILFTMKNDGTLLDGNGNSISNNKIVMQDAPIKQVPTGMLTIYIVLGITLVVAIGGICAYYYSAKGIKNKKNFK